MSKKYYVPLKDNNNFQIIAHELVPWEPDLPVIVPNSFFSFEEFMACVDMANDAIKRMMECE